MKLAEFLMQVLDMDGFGGAILRLAGWDGGGTRRVHSVISVRSTAVRRTTIRLINIRCTVPLQTSAWTRQREPVNPAHYGTCGLVAQVYK
jgi:hypothetical protein